MRKEANLSVRVLNFRTIIALTVAIAAFLTLSFPASVKAAETVAPDIMWEASFGSTDPDTAYAVTESVYDHSFVFAGTTENERYIYAVKVDQAGETVWTKTFGGTYWRNVARAVYQTTDNGFILAGYSKIQWYTGNERIHLVKIDANGNLEWEKRIFVKDGAARANGFGVIQASDGGYIVVGAFMIGDTQTDIYVCKTDSKGNVEWEQSFGGAGWDYAYSVSQTKDNGFIVAGHMEAGGRKLTLIKFDESGSVEWQQNYQSTNDFTGKSVKQTTDGGYVVTGYDGSKIFLVKINSTGSKLWEKTYSDGIGYSVDLAGDGGYVITGRGGSTGIIVIRTDKLGNKIWEKTLGTTGAIGHSVKYTSSRNLLIGGESEGNAYLTLLEPEREAVLEVSSPNVLKDGHVLVYTVLKEDDELITTGNEDVKIKVPDTDEEIELKDQGTDGDMAANDGVYSAWYKVTETDAIDIELYLDGTEVDSTNVKVVTATDLVVVTDYQALWDEFINTGMGAGDDENDNTTPDYYDLLGRVNSYAFAHDGVVFDMSKEITTTNGYSKDYADLDYLTADVNDMGNLINAWVNKVGTTTRFKNIAIIGDDKVIPFVRKSDPTNQEHDYPPSVGGTQGNITLMSNLADKIMTDIPYGSYEIALVANPRIDAAVGRIFTDRPDKLIEVIDGYEETIELNPANRTAVIYSIAKDTVNWPLAVDVVLKPVLNAQMRGGIQVTNASLAVPPYAAGKYYHYDGTVVKWSAGKVTDSISNANITMFWSHADQRLQNTQNNPDLTAADLDAMPDSPGHILINPGCHAGMTESQSGTNPGLYDDAMAASLIEKKVTYLAPTTYGIGDEPNLVYHDLLISGFLGNVLNGTRRTVGEAMVASYSEYYTHIPTVRLDNVSTYTTYGTILYGLPTQPLEYGGTVIIGPAPGPIPAPAPARHAPARSLRSLSAIQEQQALTMKVPVEIPNFKISRDDKGKDFIEIPNGGTQAVLAFAPVLPLITKSYLLPYGARVTDVQQTNVTSSVYAEPLDLRTTIPVNKTLGPLQGTIDLPNPYPGESFWWSTTEQNGGVLLTISMIPVEYNPETQIATLYNQMEFQVAYTAAVPLTTLNEAIINGGTGVNSGSESVPVKTKVTASSEQKVGVFWMVKDPAGRVLESGSKEAQIIAGANEVDFGFDTLGWNPGPKDLTVAIFDNAIIDSKTVQFSVYGIDFTASLNQNIFSPVDTSGELEVEVRDEQGALVQGLTANSFNLYMNGSQLEVQTFAEHAPGVYKLSFAIGSLAPGVYELKIDCSDGSSSGSGANKSKSLYLTYKTDVTPPVIASTTPSANTADAAVNRDILVKFNEPVIWGSSLNKIVITDGVESVKYTASVNGDGLIIMPEKELVSNTLYTVKLPVGAVEDLARNKLAGEYSFSFRTLPNTNAALTDLKVGGSTVAGFAYNRFAYDVVLPYGTAEVPELNWTPGYAKAKVEVRPAAGVRGTAEIKVTAEDGITTQTYSIKFSVAKNTDATLRELKVGGQTALGFAEGKTACFFILPYGTTEVPTITAVPTDSANARYEITPAAGVNGTATIVVTAEDGTTKKTYTIKFSVARNNDAKLKDLQINGQTIEGFSSDRFSYVVELPEGTEVVPVVTVFANDTGAWVETTQAPKVPGTAVVVVTAADGVTTRLYSVTFSIPGRTDTSLKDIKVGGQTIPGFATDKYNYEYILPTGTIEIPVVSAEVYDAGAHMQITQAAGPESTATIIVTSQDGRNSRTYSVIFLVLKNDGAMLSDLKMDGITVDGFSADRLNYELTLPSGTSRVPQVTAAALDPNASITITQAPNVTGTALIIVVSQDGRITREYRVSFRLAQSATTDLADLTLDGETIQGFSPARLNYQVMLPLGTSVVPVVAAIPSDPQANVVITPAESVAGMARVLVTSSDSRVTKTYTVTFSIEENPSAVLSDLSVNGTTIPGFSPDMLSYEVLLPTGTSQVPDVKAVSLDPEAVVRINLPENLSGLATIQVTSRDDRSSQTYNLSFRVIQLGDVSLSDLKVNELMLTGFTSGKLNYDVVLPYGTTEVPLVSAVATDPEAKVVITQANNVNGTATVVVTSADGRATRTYSVSFGVEYRAPVISSTLAGTVPTGVETAFTVATTANSDAGELVRLKVSLLDPTVRDQVSLKYKDVTDGAYYQLNFDAGGVTWLGPTTGFPLSDVTSDLKANFIAPGNYGFRLDIVKPGSNEVLASTLGSVRALNIDATLMDLRVNGSTVSGFVYDTTSYSVILPYDTTVVPVITATTSDTNATTDITQAVSVTGTATVKVTAEDGVTTKLYTVSLKLADRQSQTGGGGGDRPSDTTGPVVVSTIPAEKHPVDVNINTPIHIKFDEQIQAGNSINDITIKAGQEYVKFSYSIEGVVLKLIPAKELTSSTTYEIQLPAGAVQDNSENGLVNPYSFSFTTKRFHGATGPGANPFKDISDNHWAVNEIVYLYDRGIVSGFPDLTFRPYKEITRAEMAVMVAKALKLDTALTRDKNTFMDVPKKHWGFNEIEAASKVGVMIGYGNGRFKPDAFITREELVQVIINAINYGESADSSVSTDILKEFNDWERIPVWARKAVAEAVEREIVKGISPRVFGAGIYGSRDQASVLVYKLIEEK